MTTGIGQVAELLRQTWPERFEPARLTPDVTLGEGGLELDSVELAELAVACEDRSGQPIDEALFADPELTLGRFAAHFWR